MKERPFNAKAWEVRAIQEGRKTQFRRVVNPQPVKDGNFWKLFHSMWSGSSATVFPGHSLARGPYGQPGDRLWCRETWGLMCYHDPTDWCDGSVKGVPESELRERYTVEHAANWKLPSESAHWRPSIHMPRWASRITLEIVSIRVERLNEISEADAIAEGVRRVTKDGEVFKYCVYDKGDMSSTPWASMHRTAVGAYAELFESINGPGSWDRNDWVWVVETKVITL